MQRRQLGTIDVSAITMGCWGIAGGRTWGDQDRAAAIAAIHAALDAGITTLDTAEGYGDSEAIVGEAIADRRDRAEICSKLNAEHCAPDDVRAACEASLGRLRTDRIDYYQIHWPNRDVPLADTVAALDGLVSDGKIRAWGVSNFGVGDLTDLIALDSACAGNQVPYSLLWRAIEYGIRERCIDAGIGIMAYSPLAQGLLTGKFATADDVPDGRARTRHFSGDRPDARHGGPGCEGETFAAIDAIRALCEAWQLRMSDVALAWTLAQPGVTTVIAGARDPDQIAANARASERSLSAAQVAALDAATAALKQVLGADPDMWAEESRYR